MRKTICDFCGKILYLEEPDDKDYFGKNMCKKEAEEAKTDFPWENDLKLNSSRVLICRDCAKKTSEWIINNLFDSNPSKLKQSDPSKRN